MISSIDEVDPEFCDLIKMVISRRNYYPKPIIVGTRVLINFGQTYTEISGSDILPGRNDPCFCGSNKKFKKCCGKE
jgi:uncharacterized protein YecA (UPF0149 family)